MYMMLSEGIVHIYSSSYIAHADFVGHIHTQIHMHTYTHTFPRSCTTHTMGKQCSIHKVEALTEQT